MEARPSLLRTLREAIGARDPQTGVQRESTFRHGVDAWIGTGTAQRRPSSSLLLIGIDAQTRAHGRPRPSRRETAELLREVATAAGSCLRATDLVGRVGDDLIGVLLPGTPAQQAEMVAARMRQRVHDRTTRAGRPTTVSIGIATGLHPSPWTDAIDALEEARLDGDRTVVATHRPRPVG